MSAPSFQPQSPADASVTNAIGLLRATWKPHVEGIFRGTYSFWLGSGISRERFDALDVLLTKLLKYFQEHLSQEATCPYRGALDRVFDLIFLDRADRATLFATPVDSWSNLNGILNQLRNQYSTILGMPIVVDGKPVSIPWQILKLHEVYSNPSVEPDAEHIFLALLIEEGFLLNLLSTNWDPLIERAHANVRGTKTQNLEIVACNDDLNRNGPAPSARLIKLHGCAAKAMLQPDMYLRFMLATRSEIAQWAENPDREPFREVARTILREGPAIFVGLSGQDFNLQALFVRVGQGLLQPFKAPPTRLLFCTSNLSEDHHTILKNLYGEEAYTQAYEALVKESSLPLFAKPFLGALYLMGIRAKIETLLRSGQGDMIPSHALLARRAFDEAEHLLCQHYDAIEDSTKRWRDISRAVPRYITKLLGLYRQQTYGGAAQDYEPITLFATERMEQLSPSMLGNLHWLLLTLACLLEGARRTYWTLELPVDAAPSEGALIVRQNGEPLSVFMLDGGVGRVRLEKRLLEVFPSPHPVLYLYPTEMVSKGHQRVPKRQLPGARDVDDEVTEISLQELLSGSTNDEELIEAFRTVLRTARRSW